MACRYIELFSQNGPWASLNPLRYRGYYYDEETGVYYLNSRYYDPQTCRFINADGHTRTGGDLLSYNMFSYCLNNPINLEDHGGDRPDESHDGRADYSGWKNPVSTVETGVDVTRSVLEVRYDVPLYNQGGLSLCWAYSQTMVEDFQTNTIRTQRKADERAREIAISVHGWDDWNRGGWPTNQGDSFTADNSNDLFLELLDGPAYGYYAGDNGAHLVVITGVSLWQDKVYTNNPWGISGVQTYNEFLSNFAGGSADMPFNSGRRIN